MRLARILMVVAFAACSTPETYTPIRYVTEPEYAYDVVDACSWNCSRWRYAAFNCPESYANLGGSSCVVTCVRAAERSQLPLPCWAHAQSAAELRACGSIVCAK